MSNQDQSLTDIAYSAERDLNTYQSKSGSGRNTGIDDTVDSRTEKKFPGSGVSEGRDVVTNAGYNRRIPPAEGGAENDNQAYSQGRDFEGEGGPDDKLQSQYRDNPGRNDGDFARVNAGYGERDTSDVAEDGADATDSNWRRGGAAKPGQQAEAFKGANWYSPGEVEDSTADQGNIPPDSTVHGSKNS